MVRLRERDDGITARSAGPDRRRPGRVEIANPHLVRLLREASVPAAPSARSEVAYRSSREADSLAAARGIGAAAILGAMAWAGFLMGLSLLLHS